MPYAVTESCCLFCTDHLMLLAVHGFDGQLSFIELGSSYAPQPRQGNKTKRLACS